MRLLQKLHDALIALVAACSRAGAAAAACSASCSAKGREADAPTAPAIRGLYFWGGVGRGKTYLVDTFTTRCRFARSSALHFTASCGWCMRG